MKKALLAALVFIWATIGPVSAQDIDPSGAPSSNSTRNDRLIYGHGNATCGAWSHASSQTDLAIISWILGMTSGLEVMCLRAHKKGAEQTPCINGKVSETSQVYERVRFLCSHVDPNTPIYEVTVDVWKYLGENGEGNR